MFGMAIAKHIISTFLVVGLILLVGLSAEARAVLGECAMTHCDTHIEMSHDAGTVFPTEKLADHGGCTQHLCHPVVFSRQPLQGPTSQVDTIFVSVDLLPPLLKRADSLERPPNA